MLRQLSLAAGCALAASLLFGCHLARSTAARGDADAPLTSDTERVGPSRGGILPVAAVDGDPPGSDTLEDPDPPALTQESSHRWTLTELEELALDRNPAIQQASASAFKAMGFRDQVGLKPNPTVGYNGSQLADERTDQHTAFVEQDFVSAHKLARNQAVHNQEIQAQLWEVETQRYRVLTDVRQRFYEALTAQRRLELANQFMDVAQKGVDVAQARFNAKEGTVPEILQAEIQLNQVEVQKRRAEVQFRGAWRQMVATAGVPDMPPGVLDGALPTTRVTLNWDDLTAETLASSPELQAARARVSRAQANLDRQRVQAIPNVSVLVAGGRDNGTASQMINAQVGLPLPLYNKNQGNISAAEAEVSRTCQEVRRIELSIAARVARAAQNYDAAAATLTRYQEEILPRAARTLELTEGSYAAGEFDFIQVLVARRTFFDTNLEFLGAQSELAEANAMIDGLVLSGGLDPTADTQLDSGLRDQSLMGQ